MLLIASANSFFCECRQKSISEYDFSGKMYKGNVSFLIKTDMDTKLNEQFETEGNAFISAGILKQKRTVKEYHKTDHNSHEIFIDQDVSEIKREYKSGEKFSFYGQSEKSESLLQGKVLKSVYENNEWTKFFIDSDDVSLDVLQLLEMYNFNSRELSISYPNKKIGVGYEWSDVKVFNADLEKRIKLDYTVRFESLENYSGVLCAKFFIKSVRRETTDNSELLLESSGNIYRSVELNMDVGSELKSEVKYIESFNKGSEVWRMIREGNGSIRQGVTLK